MARHYRPPQIQKGSTLLNSVLKDAKLYFELEQRAILPKWKEIVGERVAQEVRLVDVQYGTLICETRNPSWKTELKYAKQDILEKANALAGKKIFKDLRFR